MIEFFREGNRLFAKIKVNIGLGMIYNVQVKNCEDDAYAILLRARIEKDLSDKLEAIRREAGRMPSQRRLQKELGLNLGGS